MLSEALIVSAIAGPYFLGGIFLELAIAKRRGLSLHHTPDTITSIGCGALQQAMSVPLRFLVFGLYAIVHDRFALASITTTDLWAWPLCFVLMDHDYYWFHRLSHRVSFLWAAHAVHHQSEEFNLPTALRQSVIQESLVAPFYWPLAILGFPVEMLIACVITSAMYQYWIHTRLIDRMPRFFEAIFNTPSQHRVHHAIDPEYIDKNYAGTLSIWDRLYGTFRREDAPPTFGTVEPLGRFDVLEANVAGWRKIARNVRRGGLYALIAPPEWTPDGVVAIPEARGRPKLRRQTDKRTKNRLVLVVATASALAGVANAYAERDGARATLPLTLWLVASVLALGPLIEEARPPRWLALARWAALPIALFALYGPT
jgi:sterol desaturase/sphingolipid hydroxylase (fatty acid hydroxylase superfamily)